jgi:hypothetical protein
METKTILFLVVLMVLLSICMLFMFEKQEEILKNIQLLRNRNGSANDELQASRTPIGYKTA